MKTFRDWKNRSPEICMLLDKVRQEVHSIVPDAQIILYGSRARGDTNIFSDWDFLILAERNLDRNLIIKIRDCLYDLELEADTVLSSIIRSREEWDSPMYSALPLKHMVEKEGILL